MIQISLQGVAPGGAELISGPWHPPVEVLLADDVLCLLELPRVHAQVSVCCLEQSLELVESQRLIDRKRAQDTQPHPLMDQSIETRIHAFDLAHRARLMVHVDLVTACVQFSHHTSWR